MNAIDRHLRVVVMLPTSTPNQKRKFSVQNSCSNLPCCVTSTRMLLQDYLSVTGAYLEEWALSGL